MGQTPSGLGPKSDGTQVCALYGQYGQGQVVVITGASSGLGLEATRHLLGCGAKVIALVRDVGKMEAAVSGLGLEPTTAQLTTFACDLCDLSSVRSCAEKILSLHTPIHTLLCNAGVFGLPSHTTTSDGFETQMAANHFGHVLLVHLLLPIIRASAPSRVVFVSSKLHHQATIIRPEYSEETGPLSSETSVQLARQFAAQTDMPFSTARPYYSSKLANIWTAKELARRLPNAGVTFMSLHPGYVSTDIGRNMQPLLRSVVYVVGAPFRKSVDSGTATIMYCLLAPREDLVQGGHYGNCATSEASADAEDKYLARWCYETSCQLVNVAPLPQPPK